MHERALIRFPGLSFSNTVPCAVVNESGLLWYSPCNKLAFPEYKGRPHTYNPPTSSARAVKPN